jgi:hypothetical protein
MSTAVARVCSAHLYCRQLWNRSTNLHPRSAPNPIEPARCCFGKCADCIFCCRPTISMSRVSRLTGVEFAFFSRPCPTNWTRNCQNLLGGFLHLVQDGALRSLKQFTIAQYRS